ncbi:MAG TPA: hypothetical protein EYP41_15615 [Anaerolineae bacterium]|nr:hypothetical protein [Anaerolineae bacterium]HIP73086.1 hypothetical protein [Anaerolineae bacterium]
MAKRRAVYKSYLLRLWREGSARDEWRAMVKTVSDDNESRYFANLDELFQFLLAEIENNQSPK